MAPSVNVACISSASEIVPPGRLLNVPCRIFELFGLALQLLGCALAQLLKRVPACLNERRRHGARDTASRRGITVPDRL